MCKDTSSSFSSASGHKCGQKTQSASPASSTEPNILEEQNGKSGSSSPDPDHCGRTPYVLELKLITSPSTDSHEPWTSNPNIAGQSFVV